MSLLTPGQVNLKAVHAPGENAFPVRQTLPPAGSTLPVVIVGGLTKREYAAVSILSGMVASKGCAMMDDKWLVHFATRLANHLFDTINEEAAPCNSVPSSASPGVREGASS